MNGAELIVSALENEGVQQIFGIPGEEISTWSKRCGAPRSNWC